MSGPALALLVEGFEPGRGGAERATRAVSEALAAQGVAVSVYTPARRAGPDLPAPGSRVAVPVGRRPRPLWALSVARALSEAARKDGAQRLVACGKLLGADAYWPHGGVQRVARRAASRAGRPGSAGRLAAAGRLLRPVEWAYASLEARVLGACRRKELRAIALSERVRRDLAASGLQPGDVPVVRNGVDPARFSPPDSTARREARRSLAGRLGVTDETPIALFCAQAFRLKGLDVLLRAAAGVPGIHVAVAGRDRPGRWRHLAARVGLGDRLTFLGEVPEVSRIYRGASFLVHPSRYDPCSLVVLEALASGLPVIVSAQDGASELVDEGRSGFVLADCEDVAALAGALQRLEDPAVCRSLAEAAAGFRRTWGDVGQELLGAVGEA